MDEEDQKTVLAIAAAIAPVDHAVFAPVVDAMTYRRYDRDQQIFRMGDPGSWEYFVITGILRTFVTDSEGREVTLSFHTAPCALTPAIARVAKGCSRVNCQALADSRIGWFPSEVLIQCMVDNPSVQHWGDEVLRNELIRRVDKESDLVLPADERLIRFRQDHPDLESQIPHRHIATYLGITPQTLSRLRNRNLCKTN